MSVLEKNLKMLQKSNPGLVESIKKIEQTKFEIYQGDDLANINYIDTKEYKPLYDKPIKETLQKVKEFNKYRNYPILYFFGFGNGVFYKMILANEKLEKVVIYEPDIEILYITFSLIDFTDVLDRMEFISPQSYNFVKALELLEDWQFRFFLKLYTLHIHSDYYSSLYSDDILRVNDTNIEAIKQIVISHGNDSADSIIGIKHSYHNIPQMVKNYKFKDLTKNQLGGSAIIVSTGPSLTKQLPLLKQVAPYATIISVDASLPILQREGIKPDFVCVLERVELTSQFFVHTDDEFMRDIYFVIASLAHEKTLQEIKGKKIITQRPFPYNRYLKLKEFGYIGVGMSAANMAFELAYLLGHKQTILIGQDLAYGENVSHAKGHILGEDEVKQKANDIYITAYGGKGKVRTNYFWNVFRNSFQKDIASAKNMVTINSTEGGARIEGAVEIPFSEIVKSLTTPKKSISIQKPSKEDSRRYLQKAIKQIKNGIKFGYKKKKEIEELFLEVAQMWDELVFLNKTNQLDKIDFDKLTKLADKIDQTKDIFNNKTFQELFFDVLQPFLINSELELATVIVKPTNNELEKKAKIIDWVMKHREWLFIVAGTMDTELQIIKKELEYIESYKL